MSAKLADGDKSAPALVVTAGTGIVTSFEDKLRDVKKELEDQSRSTHTHRSTTRTESIVRVYTWHLSGGIDIRQARLHGIVRG